MQGASRTGGQPRRVGRDYAGPGTIFVQRDDALHGVVVLVGGGRDGGQVGEAHQRWGDDGVSFGGGAVLILVFVDQGDPSVKVLDAELWVAHKVVNGAARLGGLQTFVGGHAVPEGVHHSDLRHQRHTFSLHLIFLLGFITIPFLTLFNY